MNLLRKGLYYYTRCSSCDGAKVYQTHPLQTLLKSLSWFDRYALSMSKEFFVTLFFGIAWLRTQEAWKNSPGPFAILLVFGKNGDQLLLFEDGPIDLTYYEQHI